VVISRPWSIGDHMPPVEGGSARDLRAAAIPVDQARQLTGLCATLHRPDANAQAPSRSFLSFFGREERRSFDQPILTSSSAMPSCSAHDR
jgi:hypothetical protein